MSDEIYLPEFHELIASAISVSEYNNEKKPYRHLHLKEDNGTGIVSSLIIEDLPEKVFAFRIDAFPEPKLLFNDVKGARKRADFIVIAEGFGSKNIIFIEAKKTKGLLWEIVEQLQGAISVLDYCNSVIKIRWGIDYALQHFEQRFVSCGSHAHKKPTHNALADGDPTDIQNPLKIKNHTVAYRQLTQKK